MERHDTVLMSKSQNAGLTNKVVELFSVQGSSKHPGENLDGDTQAEHLNPVALRQNCKHGSLFV